MAIDILTKIIQGEVSDDFFNNIIDKDTSQVMWEKLKSMCSQTGTAEVYSIFQKLFGYPKVNKSKKFEKSVISHFSKIKVLVKQVRAVVTPNGDIWDSITVVVATDTLHKEFEYITSKLLLGQRGENSISGIHSILSSAEAKLLSKKVVGATTELAHILKNYN